MIMWLLLVMVLLYGGVGTVLTGVAYRFLKKPEHRYTYTPLLEPEQFEPGGEHWRRIAVWYWYVGAFVVVAAWMVI